MDDIRVKMRDGTELSTNVYGPVDEGPRPVMLRRTPYNAIVEEPATSEWPKLGYIYVSQDIRGCFRSAGSRNSDATTATDGEDTLNWLAEQPWCDGNVTMYGGSALGMSQLEAAHSGHPILKSITPALIGQKRYHWRYVGGAYRLWMKAVERPLIKPEALEADTRSEFRHPHYDEYWKTGCISQRFNHVVAPAFLRSGWFDLFIFDTFELYNGFRKESGSEVARKNSRILIGPWPHNINQRVVGEVDFGEASVVSDLMEQEISFMDYFTRGVGDYDPTVAPIRIFVIGPNVWRDEYEWPLARTKWTELFLSDGQTLADTPSGEPDSYRYDPNNPVPTVGGAWGFFDSKVGPHDQREIEKRPDVLCYTGVPLESEMEITGPIEVKLFASSSARDTDFTAKLVDVAEDGTAISITDGIIRARYRNQDGSEAFLTPGEVVEYTIRCCPISWVLKQGHRIRVQISSSNYPAFSVNPNTGNEIATDTESVVAEQHVFHSQMYPSRITLPVIPKE